MARLVALTLLTLVTLAGPVSASDWGFTSWHSSYLTIDEAVALINKEDQEEWLSYLASQELGGRVPKSEGYAKAASYVENLCKSWGLQTERQRVPNRDDNVFAYIEGNDPSEVVVVGAHLDHIGKDRWGYVVPGADDNASGSVGVLSTAYAFSKLQKPQRTVLFQWYTAEESGLIGSRYYVEHPTFPKGNPGINSHIAMINLDMVGRFRYGLNTGEEYSTMSFTSEFSSYIARLKPEYPFAEKLTVSSGNRSDHASFRRSGVPCVWLFTGTHDDYHTRRDTVNTVNFDGLEAIAKYCAELTSLTVTDGHSSSVESIDVRIPLINEAGDRFYELGDRVDPGLRATPGRNGLLKRIINRH